MRTIRNVHARGVDASAESVGSLLDQLASDWDPLWPAPEWPRMRLDRPLGVGASGGHGPVRYTVTRYEPGQRVRFVFDPGLSIQGYHEASVHPAGPGACTLTHVFVGRPTGLAAYVRWCLVIRSLHDAVIEDLLDNAERAVTGRVGRPARWSPWVRLLRRVLAAQPGGRWTTGATPPGGSSAAGRPEVQRCVQ